MFELFFYLIISFFASLFRNIKKVITVIVGIFLVSSLCSVFVCITRQELSIVQKLVGVAMYLVSSAVIGVILFLIIYFWWGKDTKCPSCNKPFCLKKEGKEIISRTEAYVAVETNRFNNNGEIVGTSEQYVPGEKITYKETFVCKRCGHKTYNTYTKNRANI